MLWGNPGLTQSSIRNSGHFHESSVEQIKQFHNDAIFKCDYVSAHLILYLSSPLFTSLGIQSDRKENKEENGKSPSVSVPLIPLPETTFYRNRHMGTSDKRIDKAF